jgi:hypothetical protein
MKKYELQYTKGETGVFRMSLVENPATKTTLVMFDDESKLLQFTDDLKGVIYSVAMRPNMLIPRKDINGEPAMVFYSAETVEELQQNFFKNNSHNGATINHDGNVRDDMFIFESWIVRNEYQAKAIPNIDAKIGDWVVAQKVNNPEALEKLKNKELRGFSIEAYLEPVLTDEKKIEMTDEEFNARVKKVLMAEALGEMYMVGDKAYYLDKKEIGGLLTDADGVPFTSITETIDGLVMTTDENGFVIEAEPFVEEDAAEEAKPDMTKMMDDLQAENNDLKAQIVALKEGNTMMSKENEAIKKVSIEMTEELKKGLKPASDGKSVEEMSALERYRDKKSK